MPHKLPTLQELLGGLDEIPIESPYLTHYKRFLNLRLLGPNTLALPDALAPILERHEALSQLNWKALNLKIVKKTLLPDGATTDKRAEALFSSYLKATRKAFIEHFEEEPAQWMSTEIQAPVCTSQTTNN